MIQWGARLTLHFLRWPTHPLAFGPATTSYGRVSHHCFGYSPALPAATDHMVLGPDTVVCEQPRVFVSMVGFALACVRVAASADVSNLTQSFSGKNS